MSRKIYVKRNYHENINGDTVLITDDSIHESGQKKKKKKDKTTREVYVGNDYFENISGNAVIITGNRTVITEEEE